ncbi:MAG TPA: glycosyltransferase family 2 protein, partial [Candidatus Bathyarchaeia archaeon]|nr:glycosyltransferase family 2 protein [Candidatus Bathyarchaeia archaeon]
MTTSLAAVLIPAYNERKTIAEVVTRSLPFATNVLVINDRSTDDTEKNAKEAGAEVISNPFDRGAAFATLAGIKHSRCDLYVRLDADGQHPPEYIPEILRPIVDGTARFVIGRRHRLPPSEKPVRVVVERLLGHDYDAGSGFF